MKSKRHAAKLASSQARWATNPSHRILVVEDDCDIRRIHADSLKRSGYQVDTAEDGEAGWEALHANSYDLLITDNNMPKISGVELIAKLRAFDIDLPVIMATGAFPAEELTRCPWLQPAAMLLKPYTAEQMLATVKKVLSAGPIILASRSSRCQPGELSPQPTRG